LGDGSKVRREEVGSTYTKGGKQEHEPYHKPCEDERSNGQVCAEIAAQIANVKEGVGRGAVLLHVRALVWCGDIDWHALKIERKLLMCEYEIHNARSHLIS